MVAKGLAPPRRPALCPERAGPTMAVSAASGECVPMSNDPSASPDAARLPRRSRGIYLLPNLFTTAVLFSGFYAIVAATDGNFDRAGIAIFIAMVCDGLDGRIARWTNTQSDFGKEYDSLSDMVAFGLAPAVVAYQWGVARIAEYGSLWGRIGWLATFFYAACAAFRLARFNTRTAVADKRFFEGLPSPSGAALLAGFVWMLNDLQREGLRALILAFAVAILAGGLMVSRFPYLSGKDFNLNRRIPFAMLLLVPLGFVVVGSSPPEMLFGLFAVYALSGPVLWAWRRLTRGRRAARAAGRRPPD
jgi:CDP-diacylglycerol--serine O-phosphatidyltransferase